MIVPQARRLTRTHREGTVGYRDGGARWPREAETRGSSVIVDSQFPPVPRHDSHSLVAAPCQVNLGGIEKLILDEADRMLDMGFEVGSIAPPPCTNRKPNVPVECHLQSRPGGELSLEPTTRLCNSLLPASFCSLKSRPSSARSRRSGRLCSLRQPGQSRYRFFTVALAWTLCLPSLPTVLPNAAFHAVHAMAGTLTTRFRTSSGPPHPHCAGAEDGSDVPEQARDHRDG